LEACADPADTFPKYILTYMHTYIQVKIIPFIGGIVLILLILFLKYRRQIMLQIYFATKPDVSYYICVHAYMCEILLTVLLRYRPQYQGVSVFECQCKIP
jgi:hypothetical protein